MVQSSFPNIQILSDYLTIDLFAGQLRYVSPFLMPIEKSFATTSQGLLLGDI